jgi:hypothetical protein
MKHKTVHDMNKKWREFRLDEMVNEENESSWTFVYKGLLSGFRKAGLKGKRSDGSLDSVARAAAFLIKTEFGGGARNDFIKLVKKYIR